MRKTEMLWFEDVSALNEPVLSFPVFGRISMKQFFILGMVGMLSYALFSGTHGPVSAVPICIGAFLTFVRPNVGSPEWMSLLILYFLVGRPLVQMAQVTKGRRHGASSKKLGVAEPFVPENVENKARAIMLSDLSKPFRFKIRLVGKESRPIASKRSKVYLDNSCTGSVTADINGELETVIVFGTPGKKRVVVYVEDQKEPAFSEIIEAREHK